MGLKIGKTKYAGKTRDELGPLLNDAIAKESQDTSLYDKDIADIQAQIAAQGGKPGSDPQGERKYALAKQLDRAAASVGLTGKDLAHFKNDILVNQKNGNVEQKNWMARHGYLGPMLAMIGGGVGGGLAAGALAGTAVPAASGSGAAAGSTAGAGGAVAGGVEAAPVVGGMIPGATATPLASMAAGSAGAGAAPLASTSLATGSPALGGGMGAGGSLAPAGGSLAGGGGVMSKLGGLLGNKSDTMSMIGQGLGAASSASANNRGNQLSAQQAQDVININRSQENRAERGDAWKQLQHADYVLNNNGYENKMGLPSFGIARSGPETPETRAGAEAMRAEVMKRLQGGSTLPPPADVNGLSKPGAWEKIGGILAPIMTAYGGRGGR